MGNKVLKILIAFAVIYSTESYSYNVYTCKNSSGEKFFVLDCNKCSSFCEKSLSFNPVDRKNLKSQKKSLYPSIYGIPSKINGNYSKIDKNRLKILLYELREEQKFKKKYKKLLNDQKYKSYSQQEFIKKYIKHHHHNMLNILNEMKILGWDESSFG